MIPRDTLYTGEEARKELAEGIRKCREAVGGTMGTGGANSLIEAIESPGHLATNDGATILQSIQLAHPIQEMGRKILLEAVSRANKQSGDGSSTTTVLTAATIEEGEEYLEQHQPMEIKRSLEACIPSIEESIAAQKREITEEEVGKVAAISAEDEEIGARIQEIYQQIGKDGIIHWDISKTAEDSYTVGSGLTVEGAGFFSPYMCDASESGQNTNQIRIRNPKVLITKQKITSAGDFEAIGSAVNAKGVKDLVVFADEVEPLIVPDLLLTRAKQGFRIVIVKMPTLWKDLWFEDLAKASGATVVDPAAGMSLKQATQEHLGTFGNILITKQDTYIDGIQDLTEHLEALQSEGTDESLLRASRLNTKTARYFVGAHSDSALSYRRLKVEDAISAAYQALHGGVVIGGGLCLAEIAQNIPRETPGGKILAKALLAPQKQIEQNMGSTLDRKSLEEAHVYDPAPVVLNAAKNAISVAAAVLAANTVVVLPRETYMQPNYPVQL
jgi:chaperonin GroEL